MNRKLLKLCTRLSKIGIEIRLVGNYPWVYLKTVNGVLVTEKSASNHGFTVMLETSNDFVNVRKLFKVVRKYVYS